MNNEEIFLNPAGSIEKSFAAVADNMEKEMVRHHV